MGAVRDGLAPMPFSRKDGRRVTANHAYIEPIRDRANLTVRGDARVDRVLLSPGGSRAAGVRVQIGDRSRTISSERGRHLRRDAWIRGHPVALGRRARCGSARSRDQADP